MYWILTIVALLTLAADFAIYRRCVRPHAAPALRRAFAGFAFTADALPLLLSGWMWLLPDNTTFWTRVALWVMFVYAMLLLPRYVYYAFRFARRGRLSRLLGAAAAAATACLLVWGATEGRTRIVVDEAVLECAGLPKAFDGFRIVQFSDTHLGTLAGEKRMLRRIVGTIEALHPDLIVFSGDLVNVRYTELDSAAMRILGRLDAPFGVVSNIGNHDVGYYIRDSISLPSEVNLRRLVERQEAMGWRVLDDTSEYLRREGDSISLSGISYRKSWRNHGHARELPDPDLAPVYAGLPDSIFNITLAHAPQLWKPVLAAGRGDLTLSGHVHSMQMKLHVGRAAFSPARLLYRAWSGCYEDAGKYLYVNDGIGYVGYPIRLGAYPEITLIVLTRP